MKSAKYAYTAGVLLTLFATQVGTAAQQPKAKHHKYKLVDLGTFGGPMGFISPFGNGAPYINGKGAVVGLAETTTPLPPNSNLYICGPGSNVYHGLRWEKGTGKVTQLRALAKNHDNCSDALAINDSNEIAGMSENGVLDPLLGVTEIRAVLWEHGKIRNLGTLGGNASQAQGINNKGQIVGFALNPVPDSSSFYGTFFEGSTNSTQTRAYIWQKGTMTDIGTLGGPDAFAFFINDHGDIAGISYTPTLSVDGFVVEGGKMIDTGTLGGTFGGPLALNNKGQYAGQSNLAGDASMHPVFWNRKKLVDLRTFGGSNGAANALNDSPEVVGFADLNGDSIHHAFLWKPGAKEKTDLGTLGQSSSAFAINSHGQVGGASAVNATTVHAFLWERGQMVDLNDLVSPKSDVQLTDVEAIADNGEIAVNGLPKGCSNGDICGHPYVLIPDGYCDDDCEARIAATRVKIAALQASSEQNAAADPPLKTNGKLQRRTQILQLMHPAHRD